MKEKVLIKLHFVVFFIPQIEHHLKKYILLFLNHALWHTYVIRTNKMHTFLHLCFNLIIVSSTCFEHWSVHPQEDLYMRFYGISFMLPHKQSGRRQDALYQAQFWPSLGNITTTQKVTLRKRPLLYNIIQNWNNYIYDDADGYLALGPVLQEPKPSQATGMALIC